MRDTHATEGADAGDSAGPFSSVRARAMLLAASTLVPAFGLLVYSAHLEHRQIEGYALERSAAAAGTIAEQQGRLVQRAADVLQGMQLAGGEIGRMSEAACGEALGLLTDENPGLSVVMFARPDGQVRCASLPLAAPVNIGDRGYFQKAVLTRQSTLGEYLIGRVSAKPILVAARPLVGAQAPAAGSGAVTGVLAAGIDLGWLGQQMQALQLPSYVMALIVDDAGTIVARYPASTRHTGTRAPDHDRFRTLLAQGGASAARAVSVDGTERYVSYARIPGTDANPLYVRASVPAWLVDAQAASWLRNGLLLLTLLLAASLAIAWLSAGRLVVRPLQRLTETADRMGRGDLSARTGLAHRNGEIGRLARTLDALAGQSQSAARALRTLSAGNRTLLRERDEPSLLSAMCRVPVEVGGYPLALVTRAIDDPAKTVEVVAQAGRAEGLIEMLDVTWAEAPRGTGSIGRALRSGRVAVVRDIANDPDAAPWRTMLLERGLGSVISLPLRVEGRVEGTLTLYAGEADAFDAREVELLDEMAADLAFGIETIRARLRGEAAEAAAVRAISHDALTDLPNRGAALGALDRQIAGAAAHRRPVAVVVASFARLHQLADSYGYGAADGVIRALGARLREACPGAYLARIGYEQFGILCPGADAAEVEARAADLARRFDAPVRLGEVEIDLRPSIGASFHPGHGSDPDLLLRRAVIAALDAARREAPYVPYSSASHRENPERLALAGELRRALLENALTLHYQPKVSLRGDAVHGCEALARWTHPARGAVSPGEFVPIAEETGQIRTLTYYVIESAVRQLHAWRQARKRVPVAVNLSARNLYDPELVGRVESLLSTWNVPAELLEFEITESALVDDPGRARGVLASLRDLGSHIYIDDFGTGYSSLSYLVQLPVHALKIDRSFVQQMTRSPQARSVVESIVSLAHGLELRVVAEGVETAAEADLLRAFGCDDAQGYLFGRPEEAGAFSVRLPA